MKRIIKNTLAILGSALLLTSCETEEAGPDLKAVGADFDPSSVTFTSGIQLRTDFNITPKINADWGEEAFYNLKITGLESGAVKNYQGTNSSLEEDWEGKSSNMFFFRSGEKAKVELKIFGYEELFVCSDSIIITKPFDWNRETVNGVKYFLIDGFDGGSEIPISSMSPDKNDNNVDFYASTNVAVHESNSLYLQGTDGNGNGWCGDVYHEHLCLLLNKSIAQLGTLPIDSGVAPEDLYINAFIYGTGDEGTTVEFKLSEVDGGDTLNTRADISNWLNAGSPVDQLSDYYTEDNDGWIYDVKVDWEGWKLVSVPYSEFRAANDPKNGGGGDRIKETFRISGFTVSLLSFPRPRLEVSAYVDCIMLTQGGRANYNK